MFSFLRLDVIIPLAMTQPMKNWATAAPAEPAAGLELVAVGSEPQDLRIICTGWPTLVNLSTKGRKFVK